MKETSAIESGAAKGTARTVTELAGMFIVLLASACWGTSALFVKLLVVDTHVSALALAFWRDFTTFLALVIGIGLVRPAWLHVQRTDVRWFAAMGATLGIFHVIWNLAVLLNGAAVATVQQAAMPAIVAVAAWLIWKEPLTWSKILAILLTFLGTVLVSGLDVLGEARMSASGLVVGFGVPILYATWNLLGKKVRATYNPLTTLLYVFAFAALVLLPFQFFTPQPWPVPASGWLWFAGLISLSTLAGFILYTFALGHLPASIATIVAMSEIAFVAVYAYVLLNERLVPSQILGAVLVVGGVLLLYSNTLRKAKA